MSNSSVDGFMDCDVNQLIEVNQQWRDCRLNQIGSKSKSKHYLLGEVCYHKSVRKGNIHLSCDKD